MSESIADTNAGGFEIDNLQVIQTQYDPTQGLLTLTLSFDYSGEQMPDKMWAGTTFYFQKTLLCLYWRGSSWVFDDYHPFEVLESDSDRDRDYQEYLAESLFLSDKHGTP
jgi:hypothetical protein